MHLIGDGCSPGNRGWLDTITSIPALIVGSVLMILIAAGPMQHMDLLLARRWLYHIEPDLLWFAQNVLDRVAGQAVCLPILIVVAVVLALVGEDPGARSRSLCSPNWPSSSASVC